MKPRFRIRPQGKPGRRGTIKALANEVSKLAGTPIMIQNFDDIYAIKTKIGSLLKRLPENKQKEIAERMERI